MAGHPTGQPIQTGFRSRCIYTSRRLWHLLFAQSAQEAKNNNSAVRLSKFDWQVYLPTENQVDLQFFCHRFQSWRGSFDCVSYFFVGLLLLSKISFIIIIKVKYRSIRSSWNLRWTVWAVYTNSQRSVFIVQKGKKQNYTNIRLHSTG